MGRGEDGEAGEAGEAGGDGGACRDVPLERLRSDILLH